MTPKAGWMLDERAHAGPEHLVPEYVAAYDRKAGFDPEPDLDLLGRHGFGTESVLVDLGAGTGRFAIAAARRCQRVVAVDPSPAMAVAIRHAASEAAVTNLEVQEAGFLTYEHSGAPADCAYSRNALHHLPDFWKVLALERLAAALRPAGILLLRDIVYSFRPAEAGPAIEAWIVAGATSPEQGWTSGQLSEHVRTEHSTFSWLLEPMLDSCGFEILEATFSDSRVFAAYVCSRR